MPRPGTVFRERARLAEEMARTPTVTVTLRIPLAFNAWLDEYRHLSYPRRVAKQELVVEGLKLAYALRGKAGEPAFSAEQVVTARPAKPRGQD